MNRRSKNGVLQRAFERLYVEDIIKTSALRKYDGQSHSNGADALKKSKSVSWELQRRNLADNPSNPEISMGAGLGVGLSAAKDMVGAFKEFNLDTAAEQPKVSSNAQPQTSGISCPQCDTTVPVGQKFCGECGAKMERTVPHAARFVNCLRSSVVNVE